MLTRTTPAGVPAGRRPLRCPQCQAVVIRDDAGLWCRNCLWCGQCRGAGCPQCPQDVETPAPVPAAAVVTPQRCETCQRSVQAGQWPQCLDCLTAHVPPAELVPLVGATSAVIRAKRQRWLRLHPGWTLIPAGDYMKQLPGTKRQPWGTRLLVVRYVVQRGHCTVL